MYIYVYIYFYLSVQGCRPAAEGRSPRCTTTPEPAAFSHFAETLKCWVGGVGGHPFFARR